MFNTSIIQSQGKNQIPEKLFILFLVLGSIILRLINLNSPLVTGNEFRQTQTAITVWTFIKEGISMFGYQTPVFGPPWTIPMEFPIFQLTAAFIVKLGIENIDLAGRIAAILYFYLSAYFLFLICTKAFDKVASSCILLFYLWSPYTIVWSRNFMIDYASVAFCLGYFYFFIRWIYDSQRLISFVLAITFGLIGYLIKVTTVPIVVFPMAYLALKRTFVILKDENNPLLQNIKSNIGFLFSMTCIFLIPMLPSYYWLHYTDSIKAGSEFSSHLTSANLSEWIYGTWLQRMTLANWATIIHRIVSYLVTYPGMVFLLLGIPLYFKSSKKGIELIATFSLGAFLTIFTFFNLYWVHFYYLMAVSPVISILTGYCCYLVLSKILDDNFR